MGCREVKTEDEEAHFYFYLPTIVVTAPPGSDQGGREGRGKGGGGRKGSVEAVAQVGRRRRTMDGKEDFQRGMMDKSGH